MEKKNINTAKKATKSAIFALHGINYKGGKIASKYGYIMPLLKAGNSKTGKEVYTYSLLPTNETFSTKYGELRGTCPCHCAGCYAREGFYKFQSTIDALGLQTALAYEDLDYVRRAIIAQLETMPDVTEIRIHASGDFFSDDYFNMWRDIVKQFPDRFFWTYTKVRKYEHGFDDLPNANIVKSVIDGIGFNFGHVEYIIATYKKLKAFGYSVYICRCGIDKNQHCHGCHSCSRYQFVLFLEHSTGYKPEESPEYADLVALIESQAE